MWSFNIGDSPTNNGWGKTAVYISLGGNLVKSCIVLLKKNISLKLLAFCYLSYVPI